MLQFPQFREVEREMYLFSLCLGSEMGNKIQLLTGKLSRSALNKGNRAFADLRYVDEDSISLSTLFFAVTKG